MIKNNTPPNNHYSLENLAILGLSFFFVMILLTSFLIIPKINKLFEEQYTQDVKAELKLEAELFKRFVESHSNNLKDLAKFPSLTNAVMLSDGNNPNLLDLFENFVTRGEKSRLILQDIEGKILIQTTNNLQGNYSKNSQWQLDILEGAIPYYFQLLGQKNDFFTFQLSVPVSYDLYPEGILSTEITIPLAQAFVTLNLNEHIGFKLSQKNNIVYTNTEHISIGRETSIYLDSPQLNFTYITDDEPTLEKEHKIRNVILSVLFVGLAISFTLFSFIEYRSVVRNNETLNINRSFWVAYAIPILIAVIGTITSITAFLITSNIQQNKIKSELIINSKMKTQALREEISSTLKILDSFKAFYNASNHVNRQEFSAYASSIISNNKAIQALEWVPFLTDVDINAYENKAKSDGLNNFLIHEKDEQGNKISTNKRESYFPIFYVEPSLSNKEILGFDLASNNEHLTALLNAQKTGNKVATSSIELLDENQLQTTASIYYAVYKTPNSYNSGLDNTTSIKGFIRLVLKIEDIINSTIKPDLSKLSLLIEDITISESPRVIFSPPTRKDTFLRYETIDFAGATWKVTTLTPPIKLLQQWAAWLALIGGLTLTALIVFGLVTLIRRRELVEILVNKRTAELADSEEQHRAVVDNAVDGLLTIDEDGLIEQFNHAAERIFGYGANEAIGLNIKVLMPQPYRREHDSYLSNYHNTGKKKIIGIGRTVEGQHKNGSTFPIELSVSEITFANSKKFCGIVRDITERKQAEEEREQLINRLMSSNEELERFAFVCSHDLQEPLRMISSFSEKLQIHIADKLKDDEKGKKYFRFVVDGAIRSQALITDILAYSSINSATQKLQDINAEKIVNIINDNLIESLGNDKVSITYEPLPTIRGNKTQLFQLFQNLINNGIKYQTADAIPKVHISVEDMEQHWKFIIKDNGIGMEERHLKKIFDVFQRLHRKSQYAGTGVGLSICKKVVERHGGTIWVESTKGVGSTFYFTLLKNNTDGEKNDQ